MAASEGEAGGDAETMKLYTVDAFAQGPFTGNPAAVCLLESEASSDWMQRVAAEMNLSETAFLFPSGELFDLRWFTPAVEVDLCGHATLASAHVLFHLPTTANAASLSFSTKSGILTAVREHEFIRLDFPSLPPEECPLAEGLVEALGVEPVYVGRSRFDYVLEVATEEELCAIQPDFEVLRALPVRGVIVTARGSSFDFTSRFFAPRAGVNEDPATGSAHCVLAPYWMGRLGKTDMRAFQASKRGGYFCVKVVGDRVHLLGSAFTVLEADLLV